MKQYYRKVITVIGMILIWWFISFYSQNSFLIPSPITVLSVMGKQIMSVSFYQAILMTLYRAILGFFVSYFIALFLALITDRKQILKDYLSPIITLLKSVPNISFILLILIWFTREVSVTIIIFFILFPSFYSNFMTGFNHIDQSLKEVMILYPQPIWYQILKVQLPLLKPYLLASYTSGIGLAFKVGVMAEILGQVPDGIGRKLQWSYINIEMAEVFAWTFWLIVLLLILEKGITILFHYGRRNRCKY